MLNEAVTITEAETESNRQLKSLLLNEKKQCSCKNDRCGICGSDMGIYHGTNAAATYPRIIGHEMVGRVDQVGSNVKNLKVGDRVIINQVTSCGHCYPCRKGR